MTDPATLLAEALHAVECRCSNGQRDDDVDKATAILAALAERGMAVAPVAVVADGEALARLPEYRDVSWYATDEGRIWSVEWDRDYDGDPQHRAEGPTIAQAVAAALDGGGE